VNVYRINQNDVFWLKVTRPAHAAGVKQFPSAWGHSVEAR